MLCVRQFLYFYSKGLLKTLNTQVGLVSILITFLTVQKQMQLIQKLTFTSGTFMRVPSLPTKMSSISTRMYRSSDSESLFPVRKATASTNTSLCSQKTKLLPNRTLWMPSWSPRSCTTDGSRAAFCPIDATLSADWVLASSTGSYVEWLDWKTVQSSPGRGPGRGCPDRVMKSRGDLGLTVQSFRPKFE